MAAFERPPVDSAPRKDLVAVVDVLGAAELVPPVAEETEILA